MKWWLSLGSTLHRQVASQFSCNQDKPPYKPALTRRLICVRISSIRSGFIKVHISRSYRLLNLWDERAIFRALPYILSSMYAAFPGIPTLTIHFVFYCRKDSDKYLLWPPSSTELADVCDQWSRNCFQSICHCGCLKVCIQATWFLIWFSMFIW